MSIKTLNILNILLMALSCLVAFVIPFKLFLFSYVVLGPLHYLTEINWLRERDYFTQNKNDHWLLLLLTVIFFAGYIMGSLTFEHSVLYDAGLQDHAVLTTGGMVSHLSILVAFLCALVMVLFPSSQARILGVILASAIAFAFSRLPAYAYFIAFLPTLVHVVLFTGIFILNGALKSHSTSGLLSFLVFVVCVFSFFIIPYHDPGYRITSEVWNNYVSTGIHFINVDLVSLINPAIGIDIFLSELGLSVQRMVAFAYTYHYLNWFSKTSLIKWHNTGKRQIMFIVILWAMSVALHLYSFAVGVLVLLFLSTLHVVFEFPLNHKSIIELPKLFRSNRLFFK